MLQTIQTNTAHQADVLSRNNAANLRADEQSAVDGVSRTKASDEEAQKESTVSPAYTVEISEAGQEALQNMSAAKATQDVSIPQGKAPAGAPPAGGKPAAQASSVAEGTGLTLSDDEEDETVDTTNLTQYTAAQLAEFVSQGLLSQADVDAELASRQPEVAPENMAMAAAASTESTLDESE